MSRFSNWQRPKIEDGKPTHWNWVVQHVEGFSLGERTDIGAFTYINARNGVAIGDDAQIGSHCSIYSVSTVDEKAGAVSVGRNARVGAHCVIMPGVTIGENAVVGAFSFVNANIPADVTAFGQPARVIRQTGAKEMHHGR